MAIPRNGRERWTAWRSSTSPTSSWATATWPGASGSPPSGATSTTWSRRYARRRRGARHSTRSSSASPPSWRRDTRSRSRPTASTGHGGPAWPRTSSARSRWSARRAALGRHRTVETAEQTTAHAFDFLIQAPDLAAELVDLRRDDILKRLLDLVVDANPDHSISLYRDASMSRAR